MDKGWAKQPHLEPKTTSDRVAFKIVRFLHVLSDMYFKRRKNLPSYRTRLLVRSPGLGVGTGWCDGITYTTCAGWKLLQRFQALWLVARCTSTPSAACAFVLSALHRYINSTEPVTTRSLLNACS
jgi:hypothetical protein